MRSPPDPGEGVARPRGLTGLLARIDIHVRPSRRDAVVAALLLAAVALGYGGVLAFLVRRWWTSSIYSYGFLVPPVSAYLVWLRRDRLRAIDASPCWTGGATLSLAGLSLLLAGHYARLMTIKELSLVVMVAGGVLLLMGGRMLRATLFPIAYLLFMLPSWGIAAARLHPPFQLFSAVFGVTILKMLGVPAVREGTFIDLPGIRLEVADVCSGVNYLIAVIAIGIPLAYLRLTGWARRTGLILFAVAVAVVTNGLRVGFIGVLAHVGMRGDIHGPFHALQGMMIAVVGYVALFAGAWALSRGRPPRGASVAGPPRPPLPPSHALARRRAAAVSLAGAIAFAGVIVHLSRPSPVPLPRDLAAFPLAVGAWTGGDASGQDSAYARRDLEQSISRVYERGPDDTVGLYVGYAALQEEGRELVDYASRRRFHGSARLDMVVAPGASVQVSRVVDREYRGGRVILFFYDLNGRIIASPYEAIVRSAWDAARRGRNNGGVVVVAARFHDPGGLARAEARARAFLADALPLIRGYLP